MVNATTFEDIFSALWSWLPFVDGFDFQGLIKTSLFFLACYCVVRVTGEFVHMVRG